jgi:type III restriction enzyme
MTLFENEELVNYLTSLQVNKSVYEYVPYDSDVEREIARRLDERKEIKLVVKLCTNPTGRSPHTTDRLCI